MAGSTPFDDFLALSAALTGYTRFRLLGTGQAQFYFSTVTDVVGEATVKELLQAFARISDGGGKDEAALEQLLRSEVLSDEKLGPIARNVIKLWFVGTWYELSLEWREAFGAREKDVTFVASPAAYTEGLLWPTIDANPSGTKGPGYGTWAAPPRITLTWRPGRSPFAVRGAHVRFEESVSGHHPHRVDQRRFSGPGRGHLLRAVRQRDGAGRLPGLQRGP